MLRCLPPCRARRRKWTFCENRFVAGNRQRRWQRAKGSVRERAELPQHAQVIADSSALGDPAVDETVGKRHIPHSSAGAGSGLGQQCEVRPGVDPLGQEVTVFVEEAFATELAADYLLEALRFCVGGDDADVQDLDSHGLEPGGELVEQLSPEAVTLMIGVDVEGSHLTGGAGWVVRGDGCGVDRDQ